MEASLHHKASISSCDPSLQRFTFGGSSKCRPLADVFVTNSNKMGAGIGNLRRHSYVVAAQQVAPEPWKPVALMTALSQDRA
jgi:hypothetical protein